MRQYINGNPGRLVAIAPRLQTCSLYELERDLGLSPFPPLPLPLSPSPPPPPRPPPPPPPPPPLPAVFSSGEIDEISALFAQPAAA